MKQTRYLLFSLVAASLALLAPRPAAAAPRWTRDQANAWYRKTGWLVGSNFAPSTAINQLEMWQEDTFDPETIDRELGWAESLGFNSMRVFLHDIPWKQDSRGYMRRIDRFLAIADRHKIGVMFVFFDAVWDPHPHPGRQRSPTPHLHNSGWVQSPGREILENPSRHDELKPYVQGIMRRYARDRRVQVWDMFNEPDNINRPAYVAWEPPNKGDLALMLLKKSYEWAKEVNPDQPITSGVWLGDWVNPDTLKPWEKFQLEESDVISYHNYGPVADQAKRLDALKRYGRPILCTEYMARPFKSDFQTVLPYLKSQNVSAYNWGFVAGKSQTIYPWETWTKRYTAEPDLWFHDIFRKDGTPYIEAEVRAIREVTGKARQSGKAVRPRSQPAAGRTRRAEPVRAIGTAAR
jgi:hypothetical protein